MKVVLFISLIVSCLTISEQCNAAVSVGGTRLIFDGNEREASISVNNTSNGKPVLIQSWIDGSTGSKVKAPFMITPPLFRLEPGQDNILRAVRTGGKLSEDRESLYWLNIKIIPSVKKDVVQKNMLQLAIKKRLKFIYRPQSVKGTPEQSADALVWKRSGNQIQVFNPTPFYMNFSLITIGGKVFKPTLPEQTYVAARSELSFPVPSGASGNVVSWKIINDYGMSGKEFTKKL